MRILTASSASRTSSDANACSTTRTTNSTETRTIAIPLAWLVGRHRGPARWVEGVRGRVPGSLSYSEWGSVQLGAGLPGETACFCTDRRDLYHGYQLPRPPLGGPLRIFYGVWRSGAME